MINKIIDFCSKFWEMLIGFFNWVLDGILYLLSEIFYLFLDVFFSIIESIISAIDFAQVTALSSFGDWNILPDQILYILYKLNIAQCLSMLAAACLIRLTLNLIPAAFTRV
ncbi:DUF2523 family protein [Desulfobacter postgatei]|uniref:DUF2523 domain-containing protein n=1 Tax=Desulfobacter postgatei 2ac9 TaxID=879212 RepID=I5AY20_9BACT|nr:DUF2523 family protein [Desulfobacter postgatei]EIM62133.1 Protein of unknown function (DUF2523) [Desulfobacter postgatei 2ac9]